MLYVLAVPALWFVEVVYVTMEAILRSLIHGTSGLGCFGEEQGTGGTFI
jgi:hypothetical protein